MLVNTTTIILAVFRLFVLVLAVLVTYHSFTAYRRTGADYMRDASIGFGIISLGVFVEGILFEFGGLDLALVHIIESIVVGLGFLILLVSLRR